MVQNYQTDSGKEPNTSGKKNVFASDKATKEAGPILEPTKMMRCMIQHTLLFGREENLVQVCSAENKRTKFKCPEWNVGSCASPCFKCVTLNCISEDQLTLKWNSGVDRYKYMLPLYLWN